MVQKQAIDIRNGDTVLGLGRVDDVRVRCQEVAVKEATGHVNTNVLPKFINGAVRARLAAAAVEEVYRQVPVKVTLVSGRNTMEYQPEELVSVLGELEIILADAA